jgi:hypothetical protein
VRVRATVDHGCKNCHRCLDSVRNEYGFPITLSRMIVCATCGNKRCPHATDHKLKCTGSNAPGQKGSIYSEHNFKTANDI